MSLMIAFFLPTTSTSLRPVARSRASATPGSTESRATTPISSTLYVPATPPPAQMSLPEREPGMFPITVFLTVAIMLLSAVALWRRRRRIPRQAVTPPSCASTPETPPAMPIESPPKIVTATAPANVHPKEHSPVFFFPTETGAEPVEPMTLLQAKVEAAAHCTLLVPREPWSIGVSTHTGYVRRENQDAVLAFRLPSHRDVVLIADGCGGMPHGREAAWNAVFGAAVWLATIGEADAGTPGMAARFALEAAAHQLAWAALQRGIKGNEGLRTTFIALVSDSRRVGIAYAGDGGAVLLRVDGAKALLLDPQKAGAANLLAASLGPTTYGTPVFREVPLTEGDLLIAGTDGIFDSLHPGFVDDIDRAARSQGGALQDLADAVVHELVQQKEDGEFLFNDNLTLALLGNGPRPSFSSAVGGGRHAG